MSTFSGDVLCVLPTCVIVGCIPLPRYSVCHRAAIQYIPALSSWPNNVSRYQSPDSICKCRFASRHHNTSGFEDCWGVAAKFEWGDIFQQVIPSSCCMSLAFGTTVVGRSVLLTLTADVLSVIAWYFSWSCVATLFAASLTSISSLLLILCCPRLHCYQHWFLSQCFANCSCHWMRFENQETLIVHTRLPYISPALPWSSLCAAHLCCMVNQ